MNLFDGFILVWVAVYLGYKHYQLKSIQQFMDKFYKDRRISSRDYKILKMKYSGGFRYYAGLPDRKGYSVMYQDADFKTFCIRIKALNAIFIASGVIIVFAR
jgi:hypothetical protein